RGARLLPGSCGRRPAGPGPHAAAARRGRGAGVGRRPGRGRPRLQRPRHDRPPRLKNRVGRRFAVRVSLGRGIGPRHVRKREISMSRHPRKVQNARTVRPEVEALEDRAVPAFVFISGTTIRIVGDNDLNDRVQITDNGAGRVRATITNSRGTASDAGGNIRTIIVATLGGRDEVTYTCTGSVSRPLTL